MKNRVISSIKRHSAAALAGTIILAAVAVFGSYRFDNRIATAIIAITPAVIYYTYAELINRPSISVGEGSPQWNVHQNQIPPSTMRLAHGETVAIVSQNIDELASRARSAQERARREQDWRDTSMIGDDRGGPIIEENFVMGAEYGLQARQIKYEGQAVVRPVVLQTIEIENVGKQTLRKAKVQFKLERGSKSWTFFGRWSDTGNDQTYDLLPKESRSVQSTKVTMSDVHVPTKDLVEWEYEDSDVPPCFFPGQSITKRSNLSFAIFSHLNPDDIQYNTYIPKDWSGGGHSEEGEGSWAGTNITGTRSFEPLHSLSIRIIGENYNTDWSTLNAFYPLAEAKEAGQSATNWSDDWREWNQIVMREFIQAIE